MPRKHIHVPGTAYRRNYNIENIELALNAVTDKSMSFSQAAEKFGVPKTTIYRRYRGMNSEKLGRPTVLNFNEENKIVEALLKAAAFGYPFSSLQLREFIQNYFNQKGVTVKFFKDNLPGIEWYNNFMLRHPELAIRNTENIKRCRANLNKETLESYFNCLKTSIENISPENIINFDETNLSDDPGKEKVIVRRGSKHAYKIMDTSKSSTSIMFTCTGDGCMLPPYIVYKAKNLYPDWVEGGPDGAVYNRSLSGWFDSHIFEDWFLKVALPYLKRKSGKKLLIGDNLASHLSLKVITQCEENDINFVFLPPNSTHVCQPLDVAVFRPVKKTWKKLLIQWKQKNRGVIPKSKFPALLSELISILDQTFEKNIKAGFEASGIIPFNPQRVINKLFPCDNVDQNALNDSFSEVLRKTFQKDVSACLSKQRMRKISVAPGQSVTTADFQLAGSSSQPNERDGMDEASTQVAVTSVQGTDCDASIIESESEDLNMDCSTSRMNFSWDLLNEGDFVQVSFIYNENSKKEVRKVFVSKIIHMEHINEEIKVSCMRQYKDKKNCFVFPHIEDINIVNLQNVVSLLSKPVISRGRYSFRKDEFSV